MGVAYHVNTGLEGKNKFGKISRSFIKYSVWKFKNKNKVNYYP